MHGIKKEVRFGKRANEYDNGFEGKFLRKYYNLFMKNADLSRNAKVLDVACGTGELLKLMNERCNIKGYGIDIDERMIKVAKDKCPDMDIRVAKCDDMPFSTQSFDIVTVCMAYHHFEKRYEFIEEAARVIKHGGKIYIIELRLPLIFRKMANGIMKHFNVVGYFNTPEEIFMDFEKNGLKADGCIEKGMVQIICLEKEDI